MVTVEGLSVSFRIPGGSIEALSGVDLEFSRGTVGAIVGPSGCGKTSLVQVMAGLLKPADGSVSIDGKKLGGLRSRTAVIFQDYGLLPWKTVEQNAELPLRVRGIERSERWQIVEPILAELGLSDFRHFYPNRLSGGMKQRLAIARALAAGPDLLLMDEPFSSLDALTRESLQDSLLDTVRRHGVTVVLVTHSIEEAAYLADRVYVMAGKVPGRVVACFDVDRMGTTRVQAQPIRVAPGTRNSAFTPRTDITQPGESAEAVDRRGFRNSPRFHELTAHLRSSLSGNAPETGAIVDSSRRSGFLDVPGRRMTLPAVRSAAGRIAAGLGAIALFFGLWAIASAALGKPFLPGPGAAFVRLAERSLDGSLLRHVAASARRIVLAMLLVAPPAAALGLASGRSKRLDAFVAPIIYLFYPLPKIAFLPVIMLLLGLGDASKIAVIVLIVASQVLVNARDAAKAIPEGYFDSARSIGAGRASLVAHVLIPASLPSLLSALRVSLGTATAVLFFAETFATEEGLGWYIMDAWTRVDYPDMFAAIIALSIFGLTCFAAVDFTEKILCRWRER